MQSKSVVFSVVALSVVVICVVTLFVIGHLDHEGHSLKCCPCSSGNSSSDNTPDDKAKVWSTYEESHANLSQHFIGHTDNTHTKVSIKANFSSSFNGKTIAIWKAAKAKPTVTPAPTPTAKNENDCCKCAEGYLSSSGSKIYACMVVILVFVATISM